MSYVPKSEATRRAYNSFLDEVQRWAPPGLYSMREFGDALILKLRSAQRDNDESKKKIIHDHLGRQDLNGEAYLNLISNAVKLTDFIVPRNDNEEDDDSGSDDDSSSSKSDQGEDNRHVDNEDDALCDVVSVDSDDDDNELMAQTRISIADIVSNPTYINDKVRSLFPSDTPENCATIAQTICNFLSDQRTDVGTLETQLNARLGACADDAAETWIKELVDNRWSIVYGLRLANCKRAADRDRVAKDMAEHAKRDPDVEAAYREYTGKDVVAERGAAAREHTDEMVLREVDLESSNVDETSCLKAVRLPSLDRGVQFPTHREIVIPPTITPNSQTTRVAIDAFPPWARGAFSSKVTSLNRMQSVVFPCAFQSDVNMLVCAPTGAGKTNVALMAMLRCLEHVRNKRSDSFDLSETKMVYIAPMKALVQEMVKTFSERLAPYGVVVAELSGDASLSKAELAETNVIVTTPEKWDVVTRKSMDLGVAPLVRLIIIDEVHLLHNERGPVLEAIVARFKLNQSQGSNQAVRLVGLSATLPNYEDVASFLAVDRNHGLFHFGSEFREVPLQQIYCMTTRSKGTSDMELLNATAYKKMMDYASEEQVMIFVHSRKDTEFTAKYLWQNARFNGVQETIMSPGSEAYRAVQNAINDAQQEGYTIRESLAELLPKGFGIHHAGLSRHERGLVEKLFFDRHLRVLVCTSTLAWGVNLPANAVIIKGTQVFSPERGGMAPLSILDVLQMFGRAGRVGFGSALGRACIITNTEDDLKYYLFGVNQKLPIESQLMRRLVDNMNAEIALGNIRSIADGVAWIRQTYFYVRLRSNPGLYRAKESTRDPLFIQHLHNVVHTAAKHLHAGELIRYDSSNRTLVSTELGRIASHYYVAHQSMNTYIKNMWEGMHDVDLFHLFAKSHEFSKISVRPEESRQLEGLLLKCPVPLREHASSPLTKMNVLLQCYIANMGLKGLPLMSELVYIRDSAQRILRAMYDIAVERRFGGTAFKILQMYLMVMRQQWSVASPLRQLRASGTDLVPEKILNEVIDEVERRNWTWSTVRRMTEVEFEQLFSRSDRVAGPAFTAVGLIPAFTADVRVSPLTRSMLSLDIDITPAFQYDEGTHGATTRDLFVSIEHSDGRILFHDTVNISKGLLEERAPAQLTVTVPVYVPKACYYFLRIASPHWIGCDSLIPIDLTKVSLPKEPVTVPIESSDIPTSGASDNEEEELSVARVLRPQHLDGLATFFDFPSFNPLQAHVIREGIFAETEQNMFVGVPKGQGKTAIAETHILRFLADQQQQQQPDDAQHPSCHKLLYIAAIAPIATRRYLEWSAKLNGLLPHVEEQLALVTADISLTEAARRIRGATIVVASAEGLMAILRHGGEELFDVTHVVIDHAHFLRDSAFRSFEACVSRISSQPYLTCQGVRRPRLLVLSLPLFNSDDICKWLKIEKNFTFGSSMNHSSQYTTIETCDATGYHNRFAQCLAKLTRALKENALLRSLSKLIFVPSCRDAVEYCEALRDARLKEDPRPYRCWRSTIDSGDFDDALTASTLGAAGVACLTKATTSDDFVLLLQYAQEPPNSVLKANEEGSDDDADELPPTTVPITVIASFDTCWNIPAGVFDFVAVALAERRIAFDSVSSELSAQVSNDISVSELLQMVTRSASRSTVYCRAAQKWTLDQFLNQPLPLESCNRDPLDFADAINAAIAQGSAATVRGVLHVLKAHYVTHHSSSNPSFYGLTDATGRQAFLSQIVNDTVHDLERFGCISVDRTQNVVHPKSLGVAMAHHGISLETLEKLRGSVSASGQTIQRIITGVLSSVCSAEVFTSGEFRDITRVRRSEARLLSLAANALPAEFHVDMHCLDFSTPRTKVQVLILVHCARWKWARAAVQWPESAAEAVRTNRVLSEALSQLDDDTKRIVPMAERVLQGCVEVLPHHEVTAIQLLQRIAQCVSSRTWLHDPTNADNVEWQAFPEVASLLPKVVAAGAANGSLTLDSIGNARSVLDWLSTTLDSVGGSLAAADAHVHNCLIAPWAAQWPLVNRSKGVRAEEGVKQRILRRLLAHSWSRLFLSKFSASADVQQNPDGRFVCVVDVVAQFSGGLRESYRDHAWLLCYNAKTGHEVCYALRSEALMFNGVSDGVCSASDSDDGLFKCQRGLVGELRSKLMFSMDEVEDVANLDLRVKIIGFSNSCINGEEIISLA